MTSFNQRRHAENIKEIIPPGKFEFNPSGIPQQLIKYNQFCCWSKIKTIDNVIKKVPIFINNGWLGMSKWSDINTWMSYESALDLWKTDDRVWGVGFIFSELDPFVFIDFDNVDEYDIRRDLIDSCKSWTEISQSGKGYHIIVEGVLSHAYKTERVEMYSSRRFCALTGHLYNEFNTTILPGQLFIDAVKEALPRDEQSRERDRRQRPPYPHTTQGNRNNAMTSHIWRCLRKGWTKEETREICLEDNLEHNEPPLSIEEMNTLFAHHFETFESVVESERDVIQRYIYIKSENKYYEKATGTMLIPAAVDRLHIRTNPGGQGNAPKMTNVLANDPRALVADSLGWLPTNSPNWYFEYEGAVICNTWRGFSLKPMPGDVQPWLDLLQMVVPNNEQRNNVLQWFAYMLQHPDKKVNWQTVFYGEFGSGKDSLIKPFMKILGSAATSAGNFDVKGDYDDAFVKKKFVVINEVEGIRGSALESLKRKCADEGSTMTMLNPKKESKVLMPNLWHVAIITNNINALKLRRGERRFYMVDMVTLKNDREKTKLFFDHYHDVWLDKMDGANKLLHYMLNLDLSDFEPNLLPTGSDMLDEMFNVSKDNHEDAIDTWISEGHDLFTYPCVRSDYIRADLEAMYNIKVSIAQIKKYLIENYNYTQYSKRIQKFDQSEKSRQWLFKPGFDRNSKPVDVWEMIDEVEKQLKGSSRNKMS